MSNNKSFSGGISQRYALALLELSSEANKTDEYVSSLSNFLKIYYSDNNLMISRNIETKKGIKIEKDISIKIPGDIIDADKVLNFESLVKIIQDIISVIGNNQIPLFLILSSKSYKCKTFSKKEVSLSKNINTKINKSCTSN